MSWLYSRINMGIVAFGAVEYLSFTLPLSDAFTMRTKAPILIGPVMTLGADKIGLVEFYKLAGKQA